MLTTIILCVVSVSFTALVVLDWLSGTQQKTVSSRRFKKRRLCIESLEGREMLSGVGFDDLDDGYNNDDLYSNGAYYGEQSGSYISGEQNYNTLSSQSTSTLPTPIYENDLLTAGSSTFDGSTGLSITDANVVGQLNAATSTISFVARFKADSLGNWNYLIAHDGINNQGNEVFLRFRDGNLQVGMWNGSYNVLASGGTVELDEWYTVVGTYDGTDWKIYLNGELVSTENDLDRDLSLQNTVGDNIQYNPAWLIGQHGTPTDRRYFDGEIAYVAIYNSALTEDQVEELYEQKDDWTASLTGPESDGGVAPSYSESDQESFDITITRENTATNADKTYAMKFDLTFSGTATKDDFEIYDGDNLISNDTSRWSTDSNNNVVFSYEISVGKTSVTLTFKAVDDAIVEGEAETLNISLSSAISTINGVDKNIQYDSTSVSVKFADNDSPWIDLDIDSDNSGTLDNSTSEDNIENDTGEFGRLVVPKNEDLNNNGVSDIWEGFTLSSGNPYAQPVANLHFEPITIEIPDVVGINFDTSTLVFSFRDFAGIPNTTTSAPTSNDGSIRIWVKDGNVTRDYASITGGNGGGDRIYKGNSVTLAKLGFSSTVRKITLYVEGCSLSSEFGDSITVTANLVVNGTQLAALSDTVRYAVGKNIMTGKIEYGKNNADETTTSSPVRGAKVEMIDDGLLYDYKAYGYTNDDGYYLIHYGDLTECDRLFVYTQTKPFGTDTLDNVKREVVVARDGNILDNPYYVKIYDKNDATLVGNLTQSDFDDDMVEVNDVSYVINVSTIAADLKKVAKAFYVFDTLVVASRFHAELPDATPGKAYVTFLSDNISLPYSGEPSNYTVGNHIYLKDDNYIEFDTILHEYGHVVAYEANMIGTITGHQGHSETANMRDYQEDHDNCRTCAILAFDEGWAHFYAVAVKDKYQVPAVFVGYNPKNLYTVERFDAETAGGQFGEDQEIAIMRLLWDIYDNPTDVTDDDSIGLGMDALYNMIRNNNIHSVSDLWTHVVAFPEGNDYVEAEKYMSIFNMHGMGLASAATQTLTAGGLVLTWDNRLSSSQVDYQTTAISLYDQARVSFVVGDAVVLENVNPITADANDQFKYTISVSDMELLASYGEPVFVRIFVRQTTMSNGVWYTKSFDGELVEMLS
jgi:hypothetical protein